MFQSKDVADQMVIFLTSPNQVARNQAHSYLLSFQASGEVWEVCRQLMVPSTPEIPLFLSSQIFYQKLQSDFPFLTEGQKIELKTYIFSLVVVPFSSSQALKKICQCVALVGVLGLASFWEDFVIHLLRLPKIEVMLDIIDCIPFCLEEFIIAKKVVELIKTKLRENVASIMQCLYLAVKQGYLPQVLQVIKNWRVVHIPVFEHSELFAELIQNLYICSQHFALICEAFTTTVSLSPYAQLFQQSHGKASVSAYSSRIPNEYFSNLMSLVQALCEIPFLSAAEADVQRWGSELVVSIGNNFMFLLLEPVKLWDVIQAMAGHGNLAVCMVAIEFQYNLRDVLFHLNELPLFIFDKLLMCIKSLALRCKYLSHEMFFKVTQQKSEDEEVIFTQFRISAEDAFYSIFLIFNKHHALKGRGLIKELGGLLDGDEFNTEIFVFMMRSILLGITEHDEIQLLWEPAQPMVVKSLIFFLSDIGNYFLKLPGLFPKSLEYVLTHGLLNPSNSRFFIDSNAVECLRNFSFECIDLFTSEMIQKTLEIAERVLSFIQTDQAEKLIEAIICIIGKLSGAERTQAQQKVFLFILEELNSACPGNLEVNASLFTKAAGLMSSAFGALQGSKSQEIWNDLNSVILKSVEIVIKGLSKLPETPKVALLLLKRAVALSSIFADCFFSEICDYVLKTYVPGNEDAISIIIAGISVLYNEEKTLAWLSNNYLALYLKLQTSLVSSPNPDIIEKFYDLQSKLFECNLAVFSTTLSSSLSLASNLVSFLSDRVAAKSLLTFCQLILARRFEDLAVYVRELSKNLLSSLSLISINAIQPLSLLLISLKTIYFQEFEAGVSDSLLSESYSSFSDKDKERIRYCFSMVDTSNIHQMKGFLNSLSNILKGRGTIDLIIATEIAISSRSIKVQVID